MHVAMYRPQSINELAESLVVNLSLTGGNGFYQNPNKESLWTGRKIVVRDKETGEFYDDFSGSENPKGTKDFPPVSVHVPCSRNNFKYISVTGRFLFPKKTLKVVCTCIMY